MILRELPMIREKYLISVIIPVYNLSLYLRECVDSIINQTYKNLEIILVDDGSTDNSYEICQEYKYKDPRIIVLHKQNGGHTSARKYGIQRSTGEYITFVDGDDWIDIDTYAKVAQIIQNNEVDVYASGHIEEYVDRQVTIKNSINAGFYLKDKLQQEIYPRLICNGAFFRWGITPSLCTKVFKRELFQANELELDDSINIGEDAAWVFAIFSKVENIYISENTPYHYRQRPCSVMSMEMEIEQYKRLYSFLYRYYNRHYYKNVLMDQLYKYMIFVLLLKRYDIFLRSFKGIPFKVNQDRKKVVIYGAGGFGQEVYKKIKKTKSIDIEVVSWVDRRYMYYRELELNVEDPNTIINLEYDHIWIAVLESDTVKSIYRDLQKIGVDKEKVLTVNIDGIDYQEVVGRVMKM